MVSPLVIAGCLVAAVIVFVIWSEWHLHRLQQMADAFRETQRQQWLADMQEAESLKVHNRRNLIHPVHSGDKVESNRIYGTALESAGKGQLCKVQILPDSYPISDAVETPAKENSRWT